MLTVAFQPEPVHGILASSLWDSASRSPGVVLLAFLVLAALAVFHALKAVTGALRASVAASLLLLRPIVALFRLLVVILALIAVVTFGMAGGGADRPADDAPATPTQTTRAPKGPAIPTLEPLAPATPRR
jgi:hypothetical protein